MSDQIAYKIFQPQEWDSFQSLGRFDGSPVDKDDGFIHLSFADQLEETLDKHYSAVPSVVIALIDLTHYEETLKLEPSRGGTLFPHIYGSLGLDSVSQSWDLWSKPDGQYDISDFLVTGQV